MARAALAAALCGAVRAQVDWVQASPPSMPSERRAQRLAYDSLRDRVVLYGGSDHFAIPLYETWTWDGSTWTQISTTGAPDGFVRPGIAYDRARDRVVVYGGGAFPNVASPNTWEFDGVDWTQRHPAHVPPVRGGPVLTYHAGIGRVVLFGGWLHDDTWLWDGMDWTEVKPAVRPLAREGHGLVYDEARDVVVLYGGRDNGAQPLDDTWEFDGAGWTQVQTARTPGARTFHWMAYDPDREEVVVYRGDVHHDRLWHYDGTNWRMRPVSPTIFSLSSQDMAYHAGTRRMVAFGRDGRQWWVPQTWELVVFNPATAERFAGGCAGASAVVLERAAHEWPWLGEAFEQRVVAAPSAVAAFLVLGTSKARWGGGTLPLGFLGVPCDLLVSADWIAPFPVQAGVARVVLAIPTDAALVGARFYEQALVADPALPGGLGASDGYALVPGVW